jgi:hypothetical protein
MTAPVVRSELQREAEAIIAGSASTAALTGGALGSLIFVGFVAENAMFVLIISKLIGQLTSLFGNSLSDAELQGCATMAISAVAGGLAAKGLFSILPGLGSIVAGVTDYVMIKRIGRACVYALREGRDLRALTSREWRELIEKAKD